MSHILRSAEKKNARSAINTLVSRELRFGGYPSRRSRITTAPAGEIEQDAKREFNIYNMVQQCHVTDAKTASGQSYCRGTLEQAHCGRVACTFKLDVGN